MTDVRKKIPVNETSFAGMFEKLNDQAIWPLHGTEFAGCFDLYTPRGITLLPDDEEALTVETGIGVIIPQGHAVIFFDRSSMGKRKITLHGGFIDYDYRNQLMVMLSATRLQHIAAGERIAQMAFIPVLIPGHNIPGQRGWNGSTGK